MVQYDAKAVEEAKEAAGDSSMWGDVASIAKTTAIVASVAAVGVGAVAWPFIDQMNPDAATPQTVTNSRFIPIAPP